jgi:hypothetical protein|tara:strand:+ start:210 stop:812 length:603 start_codon:yes stop_codon:yes gene_type:complete
MSVLNLKTNAVRAGKKWAASAYESLCDKKKFVAALFADGITPDGIRKGSRTNENPLYDHVLQVLTDGLPEKKRALLMRNHADLTTQRQKDERNELLSVRSKLMGNLRGSLERKWKREVKDGNIEKPNWMESDTPDTPETPETPEIPEIPETPETVTPSQQMSAIVTAFMENVKSETSYFNATAITKTGMAFQKELNKKPK